MDDSRRERKKRQTRQLIAETAIRLFGEQGYEQTTVAQIAAAADVATKTFFNHFPSKEDVLFADARERNAVLLEVLAGRRPGESLPDLLTRMYDRLLADYLVAGADDPELMETYTRLVMTVPALQAKALHMMFELQKEMAAVLVKVYPDELDPVGAAAAVGSVIGAVQGAALASMDLGEPEERFWVSMRRGFDLALRALRAP
ncbi:TetR/AcrR family transcriptional regulator [Streptosporangium sp. NPDC004379]|uniref:TetR/AcrR family transcriptional regulator n=1 Tax=Streptosporangium sp. NPDC004379 TaxID=3366189 RepID=UPI0036AB2203